MSFENWELRHVQEGSAHDADQIEVHAMLNQVASAEGAAFDERISGEIDDRFAPTPEQTPEWESRDARSEGLVGGALEEVERRQKTMGVHYPFQLNGSTLSYTPSQTGVYEFCLAASLRPTATVPGLPKPTVIFEWIALDALRQYVGKGSESYRTGWPSNRLEKRARGTTLLFEELHERCGEFSWRPREHLPRHPKPKDFKDGGLDLVVWKRFADERAVSMFALGQCACGRTDWENKLRDLDPEDLGDWFDGPTYAAPLRFFLVPFHIPNHAHLKKIARKAGIVMDRARITMLAEHDESAVEEIKQAALLDYQAAARAFADAPLAA